MTSPKYPIEQNLNLAQDVINASDCAVGMLNSLASLLAGIQAMADGHHDIQQLAMLGQEIADGYMNTMRTYKDNLPVAIDGGVQ